MADMTVFSEKPSRRIWTAEPQLDGPLANFTIPAAAITFFDGQALGRDASGTIVQMDDTLKAEFVGFETDVIASSLTVNPTDTLGDKRAHIHRPYAFVCLITAAAAGDEGKKVYWKYNNQVEYTTTLKNFAGTVLGVLDSTHVLVLAPWLRGQTFGGSIANVTLGDAVATLTKFDLNKTFQMTPTAGRTITLPAVASTSPGDRMTFITLAAFALTLKGNASENINGANTSATGSTAYSKVTIESDGTQWLIVG